MKLIFFQLVTFNRSKKIAEITEEEGVLKLRKFKKDTTLFDEVKWKDRIFTIKDGKKYIKALKQRFDRSSRIFYEEKNDSEKE